MDATGFPGFPEGTLPAVRSDQEVGGSPILLDIVPGTRAFVIRFIIYLTNLIFGELFQFQINYLFIYLFIYCRWRYYKLLTLKYSFFLFGSAGLVSLVANTSACGVWRLVERMNGRWSPRRQAGSVHLRGQGRGVMPMIEPHNESNSRVVSFIIRAQDAHRNLVPPPPPTSLMDIHPDGAGEEVSSRITLFNI